MHFTIYCIIFWGRWGISFCRVAMVMVSPLAILSLIWLYACGMVVGGAVWAGLFMLCMANCVLFGRFCNLSSMVRHLRSSTPAIC